MPPFSCAAAQYCTMQRSLLDCDPDRRVCGLVELGGLTGLLVARSAIESNVSAIRIARALSNAARKVTRISRRSIHAIRRIRTAANLEIFAIGSVGLAVLRGTDRVRARGARRVATGITRNATSGVSTGDILDRSGRERPLRTYYYSVIINCITKKRDSPYRKIPSPQVWHPYSCSQRLAKCGPYRRSSSAR